MRQPVVAATRTHFHPLISPSLAHRKDPEPDMPENQTLRSGTLSRAQKSTSSETEKTT
jgi:hypothetical protein